jgi:hypothetical protein
LGALCGLLELYINEILKLADREILENQPVATDPPQLAAAKAQAVIYWNAVKTYTYGYYTL